MRGKLPRGSCRLQEPPFQAPLGRLHGWSHFNHALSMHGALCGSSEHIPGPLLQLFLFQKHPFLVQPWLTRPRGVPWAVRLLPIHSTSKCTHSQRAKHAFLSPLPTARCLCHVCQPSCLALHNASSPKDSLHLLSCDPSIENNECPARRHTGLGKPVLKKCTRK